MRSRRAGWALLAALALAGVLAPWLAPHDPSTTFRDHLRAPPTPLRVRDADGAWRRPFFYPHRLVNRLEQRYEEDRGAPIPLVWFDGRLVSEPAGAAPFLPLGADGAGRDVLARLLAGTRTSLAVALAALAGALLLGVVAGGAAGAAGGRADEVLMRLADLLVVLPGLYVIVALRAALPLVMAPSTVALLIAAILALVSAPWFARGVRAIVAAERGTDYAEAARALGASRGRILFRHLLPATRGFVLTQSVLLLPAFVLAEATLSFVGLGLPDTLPSWGTSLHEAQAADFTSYPWLLSPAAGIVLLTLAAHAATGGAGPVTPLTPFGSPTYSRRP